MELNGIQLLRKLVGDGVRHRGIDVIATEQNVLSYRDPFQPDLAVLILNLNQREIRGAAADVDDQDQIAYPDQFAPIGVPLDPRVESGLWLLPQKDLAISGFSGRPEPQIARDGIERRRHSNQHLAGVK